MTEEKLEQLLEFARELKEDIVVVTKDKSRIFIDFSDKNYDDTHIFNNYLYVWNHLSLVLLKNIEFIEFY